MLVYRFLLCSGKTGLIVIRDGDSPSKLAASFARVWQLDASTEARLTRKRKLRFGVAEKSKSPTFSCPPGGIGTGCRLIFADTTWLSARPSLHS